MIAPYKWLRDSDQLPHSWSITSDSISAWIAQQIGAAHLVLIKPVLKPVAEMVDDGFQRHRAESLSVTIVAPDNLGSLEALLANAIHTSGRLD